MTATNENGELRISNSWIMWIAVGISLFGFFKEFIINSEASTSETQVRAIIDEKDKPMIEGFKELKSDMRDGFNKLERKIDRLSK